MLLHGNRNTADNLIGITTSRAMRERGRYAIQLIKTKGGGVDQNRLAFDIDKLRITTDDDEMDVQNFQFDAQFT